MKTISVFNQKGGVGKTTTVVNLASALGKKNKKVLVIDLDPQGNTSSGLGVDKEKLENTVYDILLYGDEVSAIASSSKNVDIIGANSNLSGFEIEAVSLGNRNGRLLDFLNKFNSYDFVLIDCPPSLGLLSINALVASDSVIIPIQPEYYALEGVSQLIKTLDLVRSSLNTSLEVEGVLISMFDSRNNLAIDVADEVKKYFKDQVFKTMIPRNIRLAEAPSHGLSVLDYDSKSRGARAYMKLASEIIKQNK